MEYRFYDIDKKAEYHIQKRRTFLYKLVRFAQDEVKNNPEYKAKLNKLEVIPITEEIYSLFKNSDLLKNFDKTVDGENWSELTCMDHKMTKKDREKRFYIIAYISAIRIFYLKYREGFNC